MSKQQPPKHSVPRIGDTKVKVQKEAEEKKLKTDDGVDVETEESDYPDVKSYDPHRQIAVRAGFLMDPETQESIKKLFTKPLPAGVAMRLLKIKKKVEEEIANINEVRTAKVMELGVPGDDGMTRVTPENFPVFSKWISELYSEELVFDIPPIEFQLLRAEIVSKSEIIELLNSSKIDDASLDRILRILKKEELEFSVAEIERLSWFIKLED